MFNSVEVSIRPGCTAARGSAVWTALGALLGVIGCSRVGQPVLSQSGTPKALEAIVRNFADEHRLPGLAAGVWRRGEVILRMGVGNTGDRVFGRTVLAIFPNADVPHSLFDATTTSDFDRVRPYRALAGHEPMVPPIMPNRLNRRVGVLSPAMRKSLALAISVSFGSPALATAQEPPSRQSSGIAGHWEGVLVREAAPLPVSFDFSVQPQGVIGTFTSLLQRTMEYPLDTVAIDGTNVHFELGGGSLAFDGQLRGDSIVGDLLDEGTMGSFALRRIQPAPLPYDRHDVTIRSGDVTLSASLFTPRTPGRQGAVVFLHGSGPETRWGTSRYFADRLARSGIAALIYDKRGAGASTGDWRRATFEDLAEDAIAAIHLLARRSDIDPKRIGLFGHSQGGLVAPLAAARAPGSVAFLVAASTYPDSVWQQDVYRVERSIRRQQFSDAEVAHAMKVYRVFLDVARGVRPWEDLENASALVREERWYKWLGIPPREHWLWAYYRGTGNFVALGSWQNVRVPVLLVYGEQDQLVPVGESIQRIEGALKTAGNSEYTAILLPRAAHNLTVTPEPGEPFDWWRVAPGFPGLLTAWIIQASRGQPPRAR